MPPESSTDTLASVAAHVALVEAIREGNPVAFAIAMVCCEHRSVYSSSPHGTFPGERGGPRSYRLCQDCGAISVADGPWLLPKLLDALPDSFKAWARDPARTPYRTSAAPGSADSR